MLLYASLAIAGGSIAAEFEPDQRAALARIDSLHISHQVQAAAATAIPLLNKARAEGDSLFALPLAAKLGRLYASYGQQREGEPLLSEAAGLAETLGDTLAWCDALRWLGYAVEQQGRPAEALEIYHRLRELAVATADRRHEAWSLVGLAYHAARDGRYPEAERDYRLAAGLFREIGDIQPEIWTLNGLGSALQEAGRTEAALACYRRVGELARDEGYEAVEALAANSLGALEFSTGDPGLALDHFRGAYEIQQKLAQGQDAVITGGNIADCLIELGRPSEAESFLNELLAECRAGGFLDREPAVLARLVTLRLAQHRFREAASITRAVLASDPALVDVGDRARHLVGLSRALVAQDSLGAALAVLRAGVSRDQGRPGGEAAVNLRLELGRAQASAGMDSAAIATLDSVLAAAREQRLVLHQFQALALRASAEKRLGRYELALGTLREATAVWESVRGAPRDPLWRELRGAAAGGLAAALAVCLLDPDPDDTASARTSDAFDEIQIFKARTMAERIGHGRLGRRADGCVTAAELTGTLLAEGELLLDYYLGAEQSFLFAVSRQGIQVARLGPEADLVARIRLVRDLVSYAPIHGSEATTRHVTRVLARLVFGDLEPLVAHARHVVVVPDGAVNLVPFSALEPTVQVWSRVPSATILAALRERTADRPPGSGILAFASATTADGQPLPGAVREARDLAAAFRDVDARIIRNGGSAPGLRPEDLAIYAVLHLASHARADDQRPWSSAILVDARATGESALLQAQDITDLPLAADLVVLSACETAEGRVISGEGVLGLSSAFLAAGAPAVVATLWPVDDSVTARMMKIFYDGLSSGHSAAVALGLARSAIRSEPATEHPFFWAGFVLVGEGNTTVELVPLPNRSR